MAFLVVLETLTPLERAAFLLHDVFGYGYGEISAVVGKSEASCRQLASRARRRVHDDQPRFEASREQRDRLAARFFAACQGRDMDGLVELLAADAAFYGDGGTKGSGLNRPVYGRENVARLLATLFRQGERLGVQAEFITVNGQPGARFLDPQGRLINVVSLDIADGIGPGRTVGRQPRQARPPRPAVTPRAPFAHGRLVLTRPSLPDSVPARPLAGGGVIGHRDRVGEQAGGRGWLVS